MCQTLPPHHSYDQHNHNHLNDTIVGLLKSLYTSLPGRPVHSGTNSTSPGSILATQQLHTNTNHSHFHTVCSRTYLYSLVNWGIVQRTVMPKLRIGSKERIQTRALSIMSPAFYRAPHTAHKDILFTLLFTLLSTLLFTFFLLFFLLYF